jgi:hypothetical protein
MMAVGGATTLAARRMSKPQLLAAVNFGALLVHQYEEYEDPGWFPGQFNHGVLKSNQPRNYPLNRTTALCVNVPFAYLFYLAPIVLPRKKWLGFAPALFGMMQAVGHGVIFPRIAGDRYSPGFLASILLHTPIGITYLRALNAEDHLTKADVVKGVGYTVGFAIIAVAGPNIVGSDRNSPHAFTKEQMGHHDVAPAGALRPRHVDPIGDGQ